jgi:hypothetical protein
MRSFDFIYATYHKARTRVKFSARLSQETAPVTGTGALVIHDGGGFDLKATVTWDSIAQIGSSGGLNFLSDMNLSSITYSGLSSDLTELATEADPTLAPQYAALGQYPGTVQRPDLSELAGGANYYLTTFSGQITTGVGDPPPAPDGGATAALLSFVLLGVEGLVEGLRGILNH